MDEQRKQPSYIFLDEKTNEINEKPLKLDSSASAYINKTMKKYRDPARLIRDSIFGRQHSSKRELNPFSDKRWSIDFI